jgi:hypothetical protein
MLHPTVDKTLFEEHSEDVGCSHGKGCSSDYLGTTEVDLFL